MLNILLIDCLLIFLINSKPLHLSYLNYRLASSIFLWPSSMATSYSIQYILCLRKDHLLFNKSVKKHPISIKVRKIHISTILFICAVEFSSCHWIKCITTVTMQLSVCLHYSKCWKWSGRFWINHTTHRSSNSNKTLYRFHKKTWFCYYTEQLLC